MRLLVVSEMFPYPPISGAKIRAYNLIRQLAQLAEIDLIAQVRTLTPAQLAAGTEHLRQYCRSVTSVPGIPYRYSIGKALRTLVDPVPPVVRYSRNVSLEQLVAQAWDGRYNAAIATISGSPNAALRSLVTLGVRPLVADSLELGVFRPRGAWVSLRRLRNTVTWWRMRRFARQLLAHVDAITVTSETEKTLFADLVSRPDQCTVVPNGIDVRDYDGQYGPRDYSALFYAGSFSYMANYEAMLWFTQSVFQHIPERETLHVCVTGNTAGRDLAPLRQACPQIEFPGFVDDVRPYFAGSSICIVPIKSGGSTRLKIVESMALFTPVVSTSVGAEGLDVTHEENILIADSPEAFATQIARLRNDRSLWKRLSAGGRRLVEDHYSADRMRQQFIQILGRLEMGGKP
ncbi:MAG: glycosyltransferase family 4 protein [Chloroflexi bacterium]|nr:glycosyltransferase family 4 protein [Chloroflexota bacterium]